VLAGALACALLVSGVTFAHWRAEHLPNASISTAIMPDTPARPARDAFDDLPENVRVPPMPAGYNATPGTLPPGVAPPGLSQGGRMTNSAMPVGMNSAMPVGMIAQGGRTTAQGYGLYDGVRQQFTGKERDTETGLDYFGARYYSSAQGRFTSPDELQSNSREFALLGQGHPTEQALPYAHLTDPQTLNKYAYANNNPLRYVDQEGHKPQDSFDIRMQHALKDLNSGRITEQQYWDRLRGGSYGATAAVAAVIAARGGASTLSALSLWAARNPDKVQQVALGLQEAAGGPPGVITGLDALPKTERALVPLIQKLAAEGKNIQVLETAAMRTADLLINGTIRAEAKVLEGVAGIATSGTVKNAIGRGLGQSGNIIVDASNVQLNLAEAQKGAARAFGADDRLKVVRIIGKDFDITVARQR
jgi:RHS repeat-associated protein